MLDQARVSWRAAGGPRRVATAVSGGADSTALLLVLRALSREKGFMLSAAHVDHGLRAESKEDARFTLDLCARLQVPCHSCRVQVYGAGEDAARKARYDALFLACRQDRADALALAHHRRDQVETVLMHLFRGSGGDGLGGMAECVPRPLTDGASLLLWRPFLDVAPEVIRQALQEKGEAWREDATNARDDYLRNFLRHQVLPPLTARLPRAHEAVSRAARVLRDENAYFREEAGRFLRAHACLAPPCRWILREPLTALHPALRRRVLRQACPVELDFDQTEALLSILPGQICNLPESWRTLCTQDRLHFLPPKADPPSPGRLTAVPWRGETGDGVRVQAMPRSVYEQCRLRFRQPGDRICPLGAPGDKSLQDYWVDRRVDRPFRPYLPLLCHGGRVIWSVGVGCAEEARVRPGDDAVLLRYEGYLPGEKPL